ncbi:hypothetical protein Dimus_038952 [Dionaea muscipula]
MCAGNKRVIANTHVLRKSKRIQQEGDSASRQISISLIDSTTNHSEERHELVIQRSRLPTPFAEENIQHSSPTDLVEGNTGTTSSKKRVRGPTRGINVFKLRKELGHPIPVTINHEARAFVGKYATSVANLMGEHIRMDAPVRDVGWKKLEFGIRESIIQRVGVNYNFMVLF